MSSIIDLFYNRTVRRTALDEKEEWFEERTNRHIKLVQKYCKKIFDLDPKRYEGLVERSQEHDGSKFEEPERAPYVLVSWRYRCEDLDVPFEVSDSMKDNMNRATEHHVKTNRHHPEFFSKERLDLINPKDRDKLPEKMVDGTKMEDLDIAEMIADWCAMSEEKGTSIDDWLKRVVNVRWGFTPNQTDQIYNLVEKISGSENRKVNSQNTHEEQELIEKLALIEHERWSDWQKYVHSKCTKDSGGNLVIPKELVERWERQIKTPYSKLSEEDKDKDRKQVQRYWKLISK